MAKEGIQIKCLYDKLIKVSALTPHPKNRNKHPTGQIERLAAILKYQGWRYPIKVSKQSGFITSGHGRLDAAIKNGWKEVPVNFQDYEGEEQEYADLQADNAIASWAELDLSGINMDIGDLGPDFDIDMLGLKDFTIDVADKGLCDEDEVPESVPAKTKMGDLHKLGEHRLLCGDSTNIQHVEKLMDGEKADMVFTSPPYNGNTELDSHKTVNGARVYERSTLYKNNESDNKTSEEYLTFNRDIFSSFFVSTKEDANIFYNINYNKKSRSEWLRIIGGAIDSGFNLLETIVWKKKGMPNPAKEVMTRDWEFIFLLNRLNSYKTNKEYCGHSSNYWDISNQGSQATDHKACFPVALPEKAIVETSKSKDLLYEPFGGSGSTLIACEKTNRKCFMMELDPHYCDVIVARWEKYTGKKADLIDG